VQVFFFPKYSVFTRSNLTSTKMKSVHSLVLIKVQGRNPLIFFSAPSRVTSCSSPRLWSVLWGVRGLRVCETLHTVHHCAWTLPLKRLPPV